MTTTRIRSIAVLPTVICLVGVVLAGLAAPVADAQGAPTYRWHVTPTGSSDQFRGLDAVSARVAWVAGESGTVLRTADRGRTWKDVSPTGLDGFVPQFRDIEAWNAHHAVALAIGTGESARVYETKNGAATWSERFRNTDPAAFFDCMAFSKTGRGLALSDPVGGYFRLALTRDFGHTWRLQSTDGMPPAVDGEFAFAASGTCLVSGPWRNFWFASGGVDTPRLFHSADGGRSWDVTSVPLRGGPTAGVYSLDFRSKGKGVMVGGDFDDETNGDHASAYLNYRRRTGSRAPASSSAIGLASQSSLGVRTRPSPSVRRAAT